MALLLCLVSAGPAFAGSDASAAARRGAYLAAAAGCGTCHTDKEHHGSPYAGGRTIATRFGMLVTPNLTPDPKTGIGGWDFADFEHAMRWGIAPDDTHFLPAFPFPFYSRLTKDDLAALKAFLDRLPAVAQPNRASRLAAFAPLRGAFAVIASPFPGPFRADPTRAEAWNRGAYLVATIGRCGQCHTPRTWIGAPEGDRFLAGARIPGGGSAPNITPDRETGIGKWSEDDIATLLSDGQKPDFDFVGGQMSEIVDNTSHLDDADRRAVAVYLRSLPPVRSPVPARRHHKN